MAKLSRRLIVLVLIALAPGICGAESMSESWYMLRGRANMNIGNYKAAIEAFEEATKKNPQNREAMRSLGDAYERQGLTDKAIGQYDRYLSRFEDDPAIAFKQAETLGWSRYAYRRKDAVKYYRMGLRQRDDRKMRHRMAKLLAQDRSTLDEAVQEYRILRKAEPENSELRSEFRKLLAWDRKYISEAIEEHRKRQEQNPQNSAAAVEYAELLAQSPQHRKEAIEFYRNQLERSPEDSKLREAYADLLAADRSTRADALDEYRTLLSKESGNQRVRLKYARLVGAEKSGSPEAIDQYHAVLSADPSNADAHAGLAKMYAWEGKENEASREVRAALAKKPDDRELAELRHDLFRGQEPHAKTDLSILVQPGAEFGLKGVRWGVGGHAEIGSSFGTSATFGFEDFWNAGENIASGYLSVGAEYRFLPTRSLAAELAFHSLRRSGRNLLPRIEYRQRSNAFSLRSGFARELRYDSFLALAGSEAAGTFLGSARNNLFFTEGVYAPEPWELRARPFIGWVSATSTSNNFWVGADGQVSYQWVRSVRWKFATAYALNLSHYEEDHSGFSSSPTEPLPGGYFSPPVFVSQSPQLVFSFRSGERHRLDLTAGPSFQFADDATSSSTFRMGGEALGTYLWTFHRSWRTEVNAGFTRIGSVYNRFTMGGVLTYLF
ncbi:MAG TPA: tetratricopeptide repeat protein [Bdellovibrionota bacterium]|nr:tetratricopeptide repeat protein [Bdellovibrionota bacterium]